MTDTHARLILTRSFRFGFTLSMRSSLTSIFCADPAARSSRKGKLMPVYFVAQVQIRDEDIYAQYVQAAGPAFATENVTPLAVDNHPETIEGDWPASKTVILQFEDEAAFRAFYDSDTYQAAKAVRDPAVDLNAVLVHGL